MQFPRAVLLLLPLWVFTLTAHSQEVMLQMDVGRGEARMPVMVMPHPSATATVILLPGGDAGTGKVVEGKPGSANFLVRSRQAFHAANLNVIAVFRPSDLSRMENPYRASREHVADLSRVVAYARETYGKPIWLVGTSRGTVSGTALAIALGETQVQGLVLTSSITVAKAGAVTNQNMGSLKMPVLVVHHKNDSCRVCVPYEASRITSELKSAPVKKFIMVEGGADPEGDPCEAKHWHGFINYEKETVQLITDWMKNPQG